MLQQRQKNYFFIAKPYLQDHLLLQMLKNHQEAEEDFLVEDLHEINKV
jgi:hypothetical protein